jgi:hypothetical protein
MENLANFSHNFFFKILIYTSKINEIQKISKFFW